MRIPEWPIATARELELLQEVIESRQWGGYHELVARFERDFAAFQHCLCGVSAANGTVTLEMALEAAGVAPGDEVIVPAISFISTASAVSRLGAVPVFVDIEQFTYNIDPQRVEAAIGPKTKVVLAVHFGGPLAAMDRLGEVVARHGLTLIEDAAHAHGSEWAGKRAGSFGLAGSFSFQNSKVMTAGEGGILITSDAAFAERARSLANQGRRTGEGWFHHFTLGSNYRMTGFQAAVLVAQLERLPAQIELRTRNANLLRAELADVEALVWQQVPEQVNVHSHYLMLGHVDARKAGRDRDGMHRLLSQQGVPSTPFYPHPLYGNALYRKWPCRVEPCPVAEARVRDAFWLPHRVLMGDEETTRAVAAALRRAVA